MASRNGRRAATLSARFSLGGVFERGAAVACVAREGHEIARGLANYGSSDARRIARHASQDIEDILGYMDEPEIIHRDNLILT